MKDSKKLNALVDAISLKKNLENELKTLEEDITSKKEKLVHNQASLDDLTSKIQYIEAEIPIIQEEVTNWAQEIEEIKNNPDLADDMENWENGLSEAEENLKERDSELINSKNKLIDLKESIKILEMEYKKLIENKSQLTEKITKITEKISDIDVNLEQEVFESLKSSITVEPIEILIKSKSVQEEDFDLFEFLKLAKLHNAEINASFLELSSEVFSHDGLNTTPEYLIEFIGSYLKNKESEQLLELGVGLNSFCVPLSQKINNLKSMAIVENEEVKNLLQVIYDDCNIAWKEELFQQDHNLDAVIYNIRSLSEMEPIKSEKFELYDYHEYLDILKSASLLKDSGVGIYLLSSDFLLNRSKRSIISNLNKFGIYIDSILDLESPERILLILTKKRPENIFVAELNPNSSDIILKNIISHIPGKIPQYGSFTDISLFYSFPAFWAKLESEEIGKKTNLKPLSLLEISEEINVKNSNDFEDKANTIYLTDSQASLSAKGLENEAKFYAQIVLKENFAFAEYLTQFFQTPLGIKITESYNIHIEDLELLKSILSQIKVYLPDLNSQIEVVSLNSLILDMETRINHYQKNLWKSPQNVANIKSELESADAHQSEVRFEQWIETLPYPIASILWASITNPQNERKVKYLLHFFEAFAEFIFTILLSGLSANKLFYNQEASSCILDEPRFRNWYYKPTFGNWYNNGSCLARNVRRALEDNTKKKQCLELFGNPNPDFLHAISKKELFNIFQEVANYRNQWEGHGPIVSEEGYKNRLKILRSALSRVYNILGDSFENSFLILPVQSSYNDGVHDFTVKKFMSTRPPFKPINIETVKLMDKSKIYLITENQRKPMELLPFILVKNEICYYYSGKDYESGKARYVSYYHSEEAEIFVLMSKMDSAISLLKPEDGYY